MSILSRSFHVLQIVVIEVKGLIISLNVVNKSDILMSLRLENREKKAIRIYGFKPYFYVQDPLGEYLTIDGKRVSKAIVNSPIDVRNEREKYGKTYEADVKYVRRFLIDNDIYKCVEINGNRNEYRYDELKPVDCNVEPRIVYLDIEVLSTTTLSTSQPDYPIISITIYDTYLDKYITWLHYDKFENDIYNEKIKISANGVDYEINYELRLFKSETEMIKDFIYIWDTFSPDLVVGWNVWFDLEYIQNRLFLLSEQVGENLVFTLRETDVLDLLKAYRSVAPKRHSYRLKWITYVENIESREEAKEGRDIINNYYNEPLEVAFYNLRDVWRLVMIDKKYSLTKYFLTLKWMVGIESIQSFLLKQSEEKTMKTMTLIDTLLLRIARKENIVLPNRVFNENVLSKKYKGAIVFEPLKGIHENVAVFDIGRYYPSLILSFNISPETLVGKVSEEVSKFSQEKEGLLPKMVKHLFRLRDALEEERNRYSPNDPMYEVIDNKIMTVKFITNAIYGSTGNESFRIFNLNVAKTVTALGREGLTYLSSKVEEMGYKVIYGDTDSIFIQVPFEKAEELSITLSKILQAYFMKKYSLKSEPLIKIKFEKFYKRILFTGAKKRYAGLLVYEKGKEIKDGKIDIVGFEAIKSDYPPLTHEFEKELFKIILDGKINEVEELFRKYISEAKRRPLDDIAIYKTLSKELHEYRSKAPHVRAALWARLNLNIKYSRGSRVKFIYVKRAFGSQTDVVAYEDESQVKNKIVIDWGKQLESILFNPARVVLEPLNIFVNKNRLLGNVRKRTLF